MSQWKHYNTSRYKVVSQLGRNGEKPFSAVALATGFRPTGPDKPNLQNNSSSLPDPFPVMHSDATYALTCLQSALFGTMASFDTYLPAF